jgi:hypothetical protein
LVNLGKAFLNFVHLSKNQFLVSPSSLLLFCSNNLYSTLFFFFQY